MAEWHLRHFLQFHGPIHLTPSDRLNFMTGLDRINVFCIAILTCASVPAGHANPLLPPADEVLTEARTIVQRMRQNPRGPYSRIAWFCHDGTIQPPVANACREHGGGRQHGEYSRDRGRLAELGWHVGTIIAAIRWDEFFDAEKRHQRLRELALESYLTDIDDGWVLRRARSYRGRAQIEGEEASGRELLLRLLADRDWIASHYLLARETVRVVPHPGSSDDISRSVQRTAIELAERDRSFEPLRAEIHGAPTSAIAARVRAWAISRPDDVRSEALDLAARLDGLYGATGRGARQAALRRRLASQSSTASLAAHLAFEDGMRPVLRLARLSDAVLDMRTTIVRESTSADARLLMFDLMNELESELALTAMDVMSDRNLTRIELLRIGKQLLDASHSAGFLTVGEHGKLVTEWQTTNDAEKLSVDNYARLISYLRRALQWAASSVRFTFAEPLTQYTALDPRAASYIDDILRDSSLVGVAEVSRRLSQDLAQLTGVAQNVNAHTAVGAFGLNPGVARGRLRIFSSLEALDDGQYSRGDIVLLPETVAQLTPVAGILTLGDGNPLSHVQLLARNFAIPNIAIPPEALPLLRPLEGREMIAAVGSDGSVVLLPTERMPSAVSGLVRPANEKWTKLTVPRPELGVRGPISLENLSAALSGRVVGPKAASLGELARLFPGRVAPALAIPFGVFAEHLMRSETDIRTRLVGAYARHAMGELDDAELGEYLAVLRQEIAALRLERPVVEQLRSAMLEEFGAVGTYGLFVRSDTNVEDLPQFTGAGLSETVPNVMTEDQLLSAIPRVWASVLSPRAVAWRSNLLTNPEDVYASVLLMESVPSEKSGVLVTANLRPRSAGLTVSAAWGVAGVVGGEAAETLVLHSDGSETLISEAKTAYRRSLDPQGGLRWLPASDGPVLTRGDKRQLRELAAEVERRLQPVFDDEGRPRPWDIEFGFVAGELRLFQIRPLIEQAPELADRIVRALAPPRIRRQPFEVDLEARPDL